MKMMRYTPHLTPGEKRTDMTTSRASENKGTSPYVTLGGHHGIPRHYTTEQLADLLGRSLDTVRDWRKRGIGPKGTRIGRRVMYAEPDVLAWLQAQTDRDELAQRAEEVDR